MRLGYYYHIPAISTNGTIQIAGFFGRFLESLAKNVDHLTLFLHAPNQNENANFDYIINSQNVKLILLDPRESVPYRMLHSKKFLREIKEHKTELDALIIRGPSPLLPTIAKSIQPVPIILQIVGDYVAGVNSLPQPAWRKELIRFWSWYNMQGELEVARKSLVFVNSRQLFRVFTNKALELNELQTTTLNLEDFYFRDDTCQKRPIQILYTGRIDPAKGLLDMVRAVALLVNRGEDVILNIVGWVDSRSKIIQEIEHLSDSLGIGERIIYHGYKAIGSELFSYYKGADIYLSASQSSEGFPRTIWEAMAHCLPVVATRVGSIPDFINDVAVVVKPLNIHEIAQGLQKIIHEPEIRKQYIKEGYTLARNNTLDIRSSEMSTIISDYLRKTYTKEEQL
jgi:glycosyltransferase involved in cell wall biosynthesis